MVVRRRHPTRSAGVSPLILDAVLSSAQAFRDLVKREAGSRESFDSMVAGAASESPDAVEAIDLLHRRTLYRSQSHLWGAQIGLCSGIHLVRRSQTDPKKLDMCTVASRLRVRRFRPDVPLNLLNSYPPSDNTLPNRALDPAAMEKHGVPLLPQFCTDPMPPFTVQREGRWHRMYATGKKIGMRNSIDFVFGTADRDITPFPRTDPPDRPPHDPETCKHYNLICAAFTFPVELTIQDILIHRDLVTSDPVSSRVVHKIGEELSFEAVRKMRVLTPSLPVLPLGRASEIIDTPELPNYTAHLRYACAQMGWNPEEFQAHRIRLEYPIMHSMICTEYSLRHQ